MAIAGIGTDIIEIARLEKQLQHSQRLAERVLTPFELSCFSKHIAPARYLAKRFAVKEAAVKAIGVGIGNGIGWQQIEVRNLNSGQPVLQFSGHFADLCAQRGITSSFVSISDERHYAVATVVLESE